MPRSLCDHAAAVMGGKIYVTGGETDQLDPSVNSVYVYDPQADAWTQLASMGTARQGHPSAVVGGKLYVFGGMGDNDDQDDLVHLSTGGGGLRPGFKQLGSNNEPDLRAQLFRGGRSLNGERVSVGLTQPARKVPSATPRVTRELAAAEL